MNAGKKLLFIFLFAFASNASYGQGTVVFENDELTKFQLDGADVPANTPLTFGIFWGTNAASISSAPDSPTGNMSTTTAGLMAAAGYNYGLQGAQPGEIVFVQIRGWSSSFRNDWQAAAAAYAAGSLGVLFAETDILQIAPLGAASGPGTPIWQSSSGTNASMFKPLRFNSVPEPGTIALFGMGALLLGLSKCRCRRNR